MKLWVLLLVCVVCSGCAGLRADLRCEFSGGDIHYITKQRIVVHRESDGTILTHIQWYGETVCDAPAPVAKEDE